MGWENVAVGGSIEAHNSFLPLAPGLRTLHFVLSHLFLPLFPFVSLLAVCYRGIKCLYNSVAKRMPRYFLKGNTISVLLSSCSAVPKWPKGGKFDLFFEYTVPVFDRQSQVFCTFNSHNLSNEMFDPSVLLTSCWKTNLSAASRLCSSAGN